MSLQSLPPLLRHDDVVVDASSGGSLAVSDAAAAFVIAGLSRLSSKKSILVMTATIADAERLAHDLQLFVEDADVEVFPPWDTLPFERVSPEVRTMGTRLRLLTALKSGSLPPRVVVAPVRALMQQIPPLADLANAVRLSHGQQVEQSHLLEALVGLGYRREHDVEHRGEMAVRGGIVDVYPSTAEVPVRIDLWGDEVERLTEFDIADQRSTNELRVVEILGCRELVLSEASRRAARALITSQPWGAAQWERLAEGELFDGMESWLPWLVDGPVVLPDLLGPDSLVVVVDPRRVRDRAADLLEEEATLADALAVTWGIDARQTISDPSASAEPLKGRSSAARVMAATAGASDGFPRLHVPYERILSATEASLLTLPAMADGPATATVAVRPWAPAMGDQALLAARIGELARDGYSVTLCVDSPGAGPRLVESLQGEGLTAELAYGDETGSEVARKSGEAARELGPEGRESGARGPGPSESDTQPGSVASDLRAPGVRVVRASPERGFVLPSIKIAVLSEADLTGRRRPRRAPKARARKIVDGFFDDLAPGDFVVHRTHGVARYAGMVTRTIQGAVKDYLLLEYRGDDKLYLPTDQIASLTPYGGGESPSLSRLGGGDWQRTRAKARAAVNEVALELVQLYRKRMVSPGHPYSPDTPWQSELEAGFAYSETADQLRAVAEVKEDMEAATPMDRLVCGDVGFGKTEVAVRAVFKAVQDGRQAAILVPTTLLASQHAQTLTDRFAPFPIRVALLSRFLTGAQVKATLKGLADGSIDVVVGTHRLLGSDVKFKNLGLLVVDEEQRFGVSHKESIKAMSDGVDVLTLTASPIPRTLEMALTGIRDLSLINTPPAARQPILTYVGEYEEAAVVEAIRRELLREGQVFFVHNWVRDIEEVAARIRELVPEARVAVAHGQMDESSLERVVLDFSDGQFDVLVCTTIVESGIDMPSVNTLVVDRADLLGLGQLHQLRGRVGRSGQRAYAYLFHPVDRVLSETAYERLRTIGEHTELGSGFKIAMRDLEIRGAGNLLGGDQSGHVAAVGYDLYMQLVAEAVAELKGDPVRPGVELTVDIPTDAHIPAAYMDQEDARIEAYRRLASVTSDEDVDDIRNEWRDRFGPLPTPALTLLGVASLRVQCLRTGVSEVSGSFARPGQGPSSWSTAGPGRRGILVRISPIKLPASAEIRLRRLHPGAVYKEEQGQLLMALAPDAEPALEIAGVLRQLLPVEGSGRPDPG